MIDKVRGMSDSNNIIENDRYAIANRRSHRNPIDFDETIANLRQQSNQDTTADDLNSITDQNRASLVGSASAHMQTNNNSNGDNAVLMPRPIPNFQLHGINMFDSANGSINLSAILDEVQDIIDNTPIPRLDSVEQPGNLDRRRTNNRRQQDDNSRQNNPSNTENQQRRPRSRSPRRQWACNKSEKRS